MCRPIRDRCRLPSDGQQQPVVQGREIRHADNYGAANAQHPSDLVEDPEHLLDVLEDLVRDDQVDRVVGKRDRRSLKVEADDLETLSAKSSRIGRVRLQPDQSSGGMRPSDGLQVLAETGTQVEPVADFNPPHEASDDVATVVQ